MVVLFLTDISLDKSTKDRSNSLLQLVLIYFDFIIINLNRTISNEKLFQEERSAVSHLPIIRLQSYLNGQLFGFKCPVFQHPFYFFIFFVGGSFRVFIPPLFF